VEPHQAKGYHPRHPHTRITSALQLPHTRIAASLIAPNLHAEEESVLDRPHPHAAPALLDQLLGFVRWQFTDPYYCHKAADRIVFPVALPDH
jgi:hypothetical protein